MVAVVAIPSSETDNQPNPIMVWFDWAERLTTGLGSKNGWTSNDENIFDAVLHSLIQAMHHRQGDRISEELSALIERNPVKPEAKLAYQKAHHIALETMSLFMLERLASREEQGSDAQAFELAEMLRRTTSERSIFGAQLQLFQKSLVAGNANLDARSHEPWDGDAELKKIASMPRTINPQTYTAQVYRRVDSLMKSYFVPPAQLNAA